MKISYNWLKEFIEIRETPEELSEILTQTGLEVESMERFERIKGGLAGLVIGEVLTCIPHPNADKLKLTTVDIGLPEPSQIVCGGPNVAKGQKVIVAGVNTTIYPIAGEPFTIKKAKIRGEVSEGMICAEDEIGLGTEHDGVIVLDTDLPNGTPAAKQFDSGEDYIYEIGLTPNRGDAASHLGTARDIKAKFSRTIQLPEPGTFKINQDNPISVEVQNSAACPRYCGVTIRGINVASSPDWLKSRLRSIDLEPINNVVDITNYVLHSLGQPLHAFDADVIGQKVIVKTLPAKTKFTTLDEKERTLSDEDLMICNEKGGMCLAGVFGGVGSGVKDETTSIFLESAYFSPDWVRGTAMRHGLSTDASFRFERGTDPEMTLVALKFACRMIIDIGGGQLASDFIDSYPSPIEPVRIKTNFQAFDRLIGKKLPHEEIIQILSNLDIATVDQTAESFTAVVAPYRSEVTRTADLVEEVLRIHGINNIEIDESFSTGYLAEFREIEPYKLQEDVSRFLTGKGFHEIVTNSITNKAYNEDLQVVDGKAIDILNRSSEDLGVLKISPLFTGLESLRYNLNRKQANLKFFEFAKSYSRKENGFVETNKLVLYLTGNLSNESWMEQRPTISINHLNEWIREILQSVGIPEPTISESGEQNIYQYGASFKAKGKRFGHAGKLNRAILEYFDIQSEVFYAELNWDLMVSKASRKVLYAPISKFPEVRRDLSLVLDQSISYEEIRQIAFNSEKKLLNRINVFSVFEGEQIGKNKKAYAIAFYLQDREKTLNEKQIDKVMMNLVTRFEGELGALIRR